MNLAEQLEELAVSLAKLRARQEKQLAAVDELCADSAPDIRRAATSRATARTYWAVPPPPRAS